jgi:hypothetical protein
VALCDGCNLWCNCSSLLQLAGSSNALQRTDQPNNAAVATNTILLLLQRLLLLPFAVAAAACVATAATCMCLL